MRTKEPGYERGINAFVGLGTVVKPCDSENQLQSADLTCGEGTSSFFILPSAQIMRMPMVEVADVKGTVWSAQNSGRYYAAVSSQDLSEDRTPGAILKKSFNSHTAQDEAHMLRAAGSTCIQSSAVRAAASKFSGYVDPADAAGAQGKMHSSGRPNYGSFLTNALQHTAGQSCVNQSKGVGDQGPAEWEIRGAVVGQVMGTEEAQQLTFTRAKAGLRSDSATPPHSRTVSSLSLFTILDSAALEDRTTVAARSPATEGHELDGVAADDPFHHDWRHW